MSIHIDKKYLNLISTRLKLFKWKSHKTANHRCPFCGDSKTNAKKARGYHYVKKGGMFYYCHNCGVSTTFSKFLERMDSQIHKQYVFERFSSGENGFSNYKKPEPKKTPNHNKLFKLENADTKRMWLEKFREYFDPIEDLKDSHPARKYILKRKIPEHFHRELFYANDSKKLLNIFPKYEDSIKYSEERIVIPYFDADKELCGVSARALHDSNLRYLMLQKDEKPMVFGLDRVFKDKKIYVFEGAFDAMFIKNSVASSNANLKKIAEFLPKNNLILVFDNEPRNPALHKQIKSAIDAGFNISILPSIEGTKDVNEIIKTGYSAENLMNDINRSVVHGLKAKLVLNDWKRI